MKPGDWVGRRFQIERLAGAGAMGAVYRARDAQSGGWVALKVLHGHRLEHAARFEREAHALAGLAHPAIVRYVAHGTDDAGDPFLAMDWVEGEPLADRLARGRLGVAEAVTLGRAIADALALVHRRGAVHRDLKPSNVMLAGCAIERAILVDFGIAHVADRTRLTATGAMLGTVGFMAPEQARGDTGLDARADVYALGATLFRALTGQMPFRADDLLGMLMAQTSHEAPRLSAVLEGVPPLLDDLVARMLSRSPSARPADGATVAWELSRLGPIAPSQGPLPERVAGGHGAPAYAATAPPYGATAPTMPGGGTHLLGPPPSTFGPAARTVPGTVAMASPADAGKTRLVLALVGAFTLLGVAGIATVGWVVTRLMAPASAGGADDCPADTCRAFPVDDAAGVDMVAVYPRVKAIVREIDPSAELVMLGTDAAVRGGLVDLSQAKIFFNYKSSGGKRGLTLLMSSRSRKTVLTWNFVGQGNALANMPLVADPTCSLRGVFASAKKRGFTPDAAVVTYLTYALDYKPAWMVRDASAEGNFVMVDDKDCAAGR